MSESLNTKTFSHASKNGTRFSALRCDFQGGVKVLVPADTSFTQLVSDIAEMIGYHAVAIHPDLHEGFTGYDCITFDVFVSRN